MRMRCRFPFVVAAPNLAMSSRPSYRGGRIDSHFHQKPRIPRDYQSFDPRNQFLYPPPCVQNQHRQFRNPVQNQTGQFRPQPPPHQRHLKKKPLDFRNWEYAKPAPPNSELFTVLSYNILADYLAINHRSQLYFHIPYQMLDWQWRKRNIIFELGLWSADIMCFQEVDRFHELEGELKHRGYCGIWKMRSGNPVDGCAIFWRTSKFKLLHEESIEFNKLGLRDNVAQICVLELTSNKNTKNTAAQSPTSTTGSSKVVICNIHVLYNPKRGEIKLGQVRLLLQRAYAVSKLWDDAPLVLCGDFNCTPKSPLYNYISEQKIILSEVDRDKVSGQASAQIRSPRAYNHRPGARTADYSIQPLSTIEGSEVSKETSFPSDTQKLNSLSKDDQMSKEVLKFTPSVSLNSEDVLASDILDSTEVSSHESSGNLSFQSNGNNEQDGSSVFDETVDSSSLDEQHRDKVEGGNIGDPQLQLQLPSREVLNGLSSERIDNDKTYYDPSRWTPMEIETATGNAGCTILEHPIKLRSTYTEVKDCSGTRDSSGEPIATSYNRCFLGTVDYIWCSEGLQTVRVLAPLPKQAMEWTPGFPTKKWGSDHIALVSELAFAKH